MLTRVQTRSNRIGQQSDNTTLTIRLQPSSPVTYSLRTVFWSHHITSIYHRRKLVGQRYPSLTLKRPFISGLWIFDSYIVMNVCVHFNMNGGGQVVRRLVIWPLVLIRPQCPPDTFHYYCTVPDGNRGKYSCLERMSFERGCFSSSVAVPGSVFVPRLAPVYLQGFVFSTL